MRAFSAMLHLIRADVLERTRRYSFLIVVAINVYLATKFLPHTDANYTMLRFGGTHLGGGYRGVFNSAWVGTVVAWISPMLLSLFGFYLVKDTLERDHQTRVGAILASTPISNLQYLLGKWLSNLTVFSALVAVMVLTATGVQILRREVLTIEPWPLISPFLFIVLPTMSLVAALAIIFETMPGLRSGFGNVLYFFLWPLIFVMPMANFTETGLLPKFDPSGGSFLLHEMMLAVQKVEPGYHGGFGGIEIGIPFNTLRTFEWGGITWTSEILFERLLWMIASLLLVLIAVPIFHRFNSTHPLHPGYRYHGGISRNLWGRVSNRVYEVVFPKIDILQRRIYPSLRLPTVHLGDRSAFLRALKTEMRIMVKGQPWWWYLGALSLIYFCLCSPEEDIRRTWLPIAWIWPLTIWSSLGIKEIRHRTTELIFSSPNPLRRQLTAVWTCGVIFTGLTGMGAMISFLISGTWSCALAWLLAILFIPSLATALGVWSGGSKLFEVTYLLLWYLGPIEGIPALDFLGALNDPLKSGIPLQFSLATLVFITAAYLGRYRQLQR
jgi:heme/copper-type cytochrome/quinol oxidase subunit 2